MAEKGRYNVVDLRYTHKSLENKKSDKFFENLIEQNQEADEKIKWLNTNEAAEFLRLTPNALRIMVHRAQVKHFKFGRRLRFRESDLHSLFQLREE
ncbi:MAG: helix-turn-helix domain-containing protein [Bacteriovoracaceae bacterium]